MFGLLVNAILMWNWYIISPISPKSEFIRQTDVSLVWVRACQTIASKGNRTSKPGMFLWIWEIFHTHVSLPHSKFWDRVESENHRKDNESLKEFHPKVSSIVIPNSNRTPGKLSSSDTQSFTWICFADCSHCSQVDF